MAATARAMQASSGDTLFDEAEESGSYASLSSGVVKLIKTLEDGRQQIVGLQFAPCLIGNLSAPEASVTVEAVGPVFYCKIPREELDARRAENPQLESHLMGELLNELEIARDTMLSLGRKTARERVASFLLRMHEAGGRNASFELALTRTDMADYLGLTLETVSRQLSALKRTGVVEFPHLREVYVRDLARLEAAAGS